MGSSSPIFPDPNQGRTGKRDAREKRNIMFFASSSQKQGFYLLQNYPWNTVSCITSCIPMSPLVVRKERRFDAESGFPKRNDQRTGNPLLWDRSMSIPYLIALKQRKEDIPTFRFMSGARRKNRHINASVNLILNSTWRSWKSKTSGRRNLADFGVSGGLSRRLPDRTGHGRGGRTMRAGWGFQDNPKYFVITGWILQAYGGNV